MKRWIYILLIVLVLITLGIVDLVCVNGTFKKMQNRVYDLSALIESNETETTIKQNAEEVEQYWLKNEKRLTLFLYYRDIDSLGKQVDLVCALIKNNDFDEAKIEITQLKYLLRSASKVYEFNFDNLL